MKRQGGGTGALMPVMLCFFVMGFVDLVGIAANYVQKDLQLSHAMTNLFPSLVFFWFLIFPVPVGLLMNRIGRKRTVLLSLCLTLGALATPLWGNTFGIMLWAFALLGIGNAFMQTSLNPLVSNVIPGSRLASALTFGQFVKAIASLLAPLIAMWGAMGILPGFGLGWRVLFPIYGLICLAAIWCLGKTPIEEASRDRASGLGECLKLLHNRFVLLSICGVVCHVGIDVGINTTAPRILMERCGMILEDAGIAASLYFACRTLGSLLGAALLRRVPAKPFFLVSSFAMLLALGALLTAQTSTTIYACIAIIGLGNTNIFPIIFAQTLLRLPEEGNEVSGLMIMGLFGGTVFPLIMGLFSDLFSSQTAAVAIMVIGAAYLTAYGRRLGSPVQAR